MIKRRIASIALAAVISMSAVTAMSASASAEWVKSSSGYSYKDDSTGKKLTGWQTIDENKYYFDKKGIAVTGWKTIGEDTYYFNSSKKGKMLTGWNKIGDSRYYFGKDGKMRTGFVKLSGKTYYFGTDGKMRTGKLKINGKTYDFGKDGVLKSSASSSGSASKVLAPLSGFKWGMSQDQVLEKGNFDKYFNVDSMIMVTDSTPYKYYLFDKNDKLCCVGYISEDSSSVNTFKKYFKDDGWKFEVSSKEDGTVSSVYSQDNGFLR